jgi:hypothetical protein
MAGRHIDEALRAGTSPSLDAYTKELEDTYGPYYRLGRRFVRLIGHPALMERLVSVAMRSRTAMEFALTVLANLEDPNERTLDQRGLRIWKKLAELKS